MAQIQHRSADKTVATIAARNLLNPKRPNMTVLVMDAIGDPYAGSGKALYRWIAESETWFLVAKDNVETMNFADEGKTINGNKVQASFIPAGATVWDVYVLADVANNIIYQVEYSVSGAEITIYPDTPGEFDGKTLKYKYAYGTISQQLDVVLAEKADKADTYTRQEVNALLSGVGGGVADYNELQNKPELGTAAAKNVPASGQAGPGEVVLGNDPRLSDQRAPTAHGHAITEVVGLRDELDDAAQAIAALQALLNSDSADLDTLQEVVNYIESNRSLIEGVTTSKVNVSDIINTLTSLATDKPLAAAQGKALKDLIDALTSVVAGKANASDVYTKAQVDAITGDINAALVAILGG